MTVSRFSMTASMTLEQSLPVSEVSQGRIHVALFIQLPLYLHVKASTGPVCDVFSDFGGLGFYVVGVSGSGSTVSSSTSLGACAEIRISSTRRRV